MTERIANIAERTGLTVSIGTAFASCALSDWALITGIIGTVLTVSVSCYCKIKRLRLDEQLASEELHLHRRENDIIDKILK